MFAYCNNDPVDCYDADGEGSIWVLLFLDRCFGFVHNCVATDIQVKYSVSKEYWLNGMSFRADIVAEDGSVWEIKSVYADPTEARQQANQYIGKTTIRENITIIKLGAAHAFRNIFYIYDGEYYYRVYYDTPQEGIIMYMVSPGQAAPEEGYKIYRYNSKTKNSYSYSITSPLPQTAPVFFPPSTPRADPGFGGGGGAPWQNVLRPQIA